jgi:hypothetical protein
MSFLSPIFSNSHIEKNTLMSNRQTTIRIKKLSAVMTLCLVLLGFQAQGQYCAASVTNILNIEKITNITFNTINNNSDLNNVGYENFTSVSTTVEQGNTYAFSTTVSSSFPGDQVIAWIDYNQDFDFTDAGEQVFISVAGNTNPFLVTGYIVIPAGATLGATRMRVRVHRTNAGPNETPCGNSSFGQVEDYTINIAACSSAIPNPGNTVSSVAPPVCTGQGAQSFTLSMANGTVGSAHQWQSSPDNITWTNISGATSATHTVSSISAVTWYRCQVTNCAGSVYSTPLQVTVVACYCAASVTSTLNIEKITNITFNTINNNSSLNTVGYENFTSVSTTVEQGNIYAFSATISSWYTGDQVLAWIDFNQDKDFEDAGEQIYSSNVFNICTGCPNSISINTSITIPTGATLGATRLRVRVHRFDFGPNSTPCGNSTYGQVEDYTVNIVPCQTYYYIDNDNDGYGTGVGTLSCGVPIAGQVTNNADCNDAVATINPSVTELCNNVDDNCNSIIDDVHTLFNSTNVPVTISTTAAVTVTSTRVISGTTGTITDINLKDLAITHTWVGDLKGTLTSPQGTVITLFDRPGVPATPEGCGRDNLAVSFNDQTTLTATNFENTCNIQVRLFRAHISL